MYGYTIGLRMANGWKRAARRGGAAAAMLVLGGCMMMSHAERPAESEFGLGPRTSAGGVYEAALEPAAPLRVRRMQSVRLRVRAAGQAPVEGAAITVDGGMPEHGHGLPTTPRVTRALGDGTYQVDGVRFNMGGWWELKFRITSAAGTDSVTFNLDL
ncbi:MAG TPA: FixH family protein [Longimicrobium sp.]|nr:FixH family protein [Longimicrobium sp.]